MSHLVPDWNMEEDSTIFRDGLCTSLQKKSPGLDSELVELFWENGHVVMHSQTHRKPSATVGELGQAHTSGLAPKCEGAPDNSSNPIQDDTAAWFEYPLEDSLERELCSGFFNEMPTADTIRSDKLNKDVSLDERFVKFGAAEQSNVFMGSVSQHSSLSFQESTMLPPNLHTENVFRNSNSCFKGGTMPPPKSLVTGSTPSLVDGGVFMSNFRRPVKADFGSTRESLRKNGSQNGVPVEVGESSSMRSIGSSMCGSNQVHNWAEVSQNLSDDVTGVLVKGFKKDAQLPHERVRTDIFEATITSSSGLSGSSFGRTGQQSTSNQSHKRKGRDGEESECHSEDAENESIDANKPVQRSASTRRTRAAEVHNLSERRRRDRINEKMKALQELIPHCNKSDKASMLDEAIEYLKSLQLQIQIMWMGSGMAQLMFPGIQQYLSRMGMGMGHSPIPPIHGPVQLPGAPLVNQSIPTALGTNQTPMCPSPSLNPANFPNQMQNAHFPESYAQYLRLHHMQPPPQAMNLYTYGSHMAQQNQSAVAASSSGLSTNTGGPYENMKGQGNAR